MQGFGVDVRVDYGVSKVDGSVIFEEDQDLVAFNPIFETVESKQIPKRRPNEATPRSIFKRSKEEETL